MKALFLKTLKWIIILLASFVIRRICESFCDILGSAQYTNQAWKALLDSNTYLMLVAACGLILMIFRYFVTTVWWPYKVCFDASKCEVPKADFIKDDPDRVEKISYKDGAQVFLFVIPAFLFAYLAAFSIKNTQDFWLWLVALPFFDLVAYYIGRLAPFFYYKCRVWIKGFRLILAGTGIVRQIMKSGRVPDDADKLRQDAQTELAQMVQWYKEYIKAFSTGPHFLLWDLVDTLPSLIFLLVYFYSKNETIAACSAFIPLFGISFLNIALNWPYYRVYMIFLVEAR